MKATLLAVLGTAAAITLLVPSAASGGGGGDPPDANPPPEVDPPPEQSEPKPARLSVRVKGLKAGKLPVLGRAIAIGRLGPFVPGQRVRVQFVRSGRVVKGALVRVRRVPGRVFGRFKLRSPKLTKPGNYRVRAFRRGNLEQAGARTRSKRFALSFPKLRQGNRGPKVALFNKLLRKRGYHAPRSRSFGLGTARAVLAFRKVNRMSRTMSATSGIYRRLAAGKGSFKLRQLRSGRHVEVDISRQVMVLADKGKPRHTFHISSGKASTPSTRGHFRFYRREPGLNGVGMFWSVYYHGGEAIHGYKSVPTYPASAGCIRNPMPNSRFIYDWVRLGMSIYVY